MTTVSLSSSDITDRDLNILKHKWYYNTKNADITKLLGWSKSTISRTVRKCEHLKDELMTQWEGTPPLVAAAQAAEIKDAEQAEQTELQQLAPTIEQEQEAPAHFVSTDVVTVAIDGKVHTFDRTHPNYESIRDAVVGQDWQAVEENADYQKKFSKLTFGFFEITEYGEIFHQGERMVDNELTDTILELHQKQIKPAAILKFMDRLKENPSLTSIESAIRFIVNNRLPIDKDGYLMCYKRVNNDFTDCYTSTMDNSVGQMVAMKRDQVTLNPNQSCAAGLHVCAESYLSSYHDGKKTVVCKVDPADIVSVPHDYNNAKMRVMRYEVIHELDYVNGERIPDDIIDDTCSWYK
ncbi:MAG: hypothetical protein JXR12_05445 [Neptunomonas phycophila]|uniref:hypothetical protein n=1 Tax=Neptunomonas phycophila TaxID=1572645 RepID=UPI003B8BCED9